MVPENLYSIPLYAKLPAHANTVVVLAMTSANAYVTARGVGAGKCLANLVRSGRKQPQQIPLGSLSSPSLFPVHAARSSQAAGAHGPSESRAHTNLCQRDIHKKLLYVNVTKGKQALVSKQAFCKGSDASVPRVSQAFSHFWNTPMTTVISAEQAISLSKQPGTLLLDVRSDTEIAATGTAQGALCIPALSVRRKADPASPELEPIFKRASRIIVFCAVGARASAVSAQLTTLGYPNVLLFNSFSEWIAAGGAVRAA
jgi:rhodanese-related sulfurtransferase